MNGEDSPNDPVPEAPPAEVDLKKRLAFLDMTEADAQRLRAWSPALADTAADFVETFYRHLLSFDETARLLQDASMVERLKRLQQAHLQ